jgi:hypothetical protein
MGKQPRSVTGTSSAALRHALESGDAQPFDEIRYDQRLSGGGRGGALQQRQQRGSVTVNGPPVLSAALKGIHDAPHQRRRHVDLVHDTRKTRAKDKGQRQRQRRVAERQSVYGRVRVRVS